MFRLIERIYKSKEITAINDFSNAIALTEEEEEPASDETQSPRTLKEERKKRLDEMQLEARAILHSGFMQKMFVLLTQRKYRCFIFYDLDNDAIIIPNRLRFVDAIIHCKSYEIFKAGTFSTFHKQMMKRNCVEIVVPCDTRSVVPLDEAVAYEIQSQDCREFIRTGVALLMAIHR